MPKSAAFRSTAARWVALAGLLMFAGLAWGDAPGDWLAKVPPPPKSLDEAQASCGGPSYDPGKDPWRKFGPQLEAAIDQDKKDVQAKLGANDPQAQQDMAAQMMAQMSDPSAMQNYMQSAQTYNQYLQDLNQHGPGTQAEALFGPAYATGKGAVNSVLKARDAALAKCPQESGEGGSGPAAKCANPVYADAETKKTGAANSYLASVGKSWPQYVTGLRDFLGKLAAVPAGVDANNPQIKAQRAGISSQQLDAVKQAADVSRQICSNAGGLKTQSNPGG